MNTETAIINYISKVSNGILQIGVQHAMQIIDIVKATPQQQAFAKLSRFNGATNSYETICTTPTTNEAIQQAINAALNKPQVNEVYVYDLYNSNHEFEGKIYTVNPELF